MAESPKGGSSGGEFAKKVQRQLSRGKEKVLQKLGKTVESRDEQFEHCQQLFNDQQTDGNRIYKDLRNYINAVRDMREASRRLFQSLFDAYESDWVGEDDLGAIVEGEDLLWNDYEVKLLDQAVRTMESYVSQFPDVREKIAKRGRKLVDFDSSLHHLEALQTAKKRDDIKINKAKEEMKMAKSVYESINSELKEELPVLYDSRVGCFVAVFSAMSTLRDTFYKEMSTFNMDMQNVMKELQAQHPDKVFAVKGLQRYGSLKRRTLLSPTAWRSSFAEFHRSYNPRGSLRFSFKSPEKPRHSTLTRESSTSAVSSPSHLEENPLSESRELDADGSDHSVEEDAAGASGSEVKSEEDGSQAEKESKAPAESEAPPSESSSELNNTCDSESLELSAANNSPLHIEEEAERDDALKANGLENGSLSGLHKEGPAEKEAAPPDSKSTVV